MPSSEADTDPPHQDLRSPAKPPSLLLSLPVELVMMIVSYVIGSGHAYWPLTISKNLAPKTAEELSALRRKVSTSPTGAHLSILYVNRVLHDIAASIFYNRVMVAVDEEPGNLRYVPRHIRDRLKRLNYPAQFITGFRKLRKHDGVPPAVREIWCGRNPRLTGVPPPDRKRILKSFQRLIQRPCRVYLPHGPDLWRGHDMQPNEVDGHGRILRQGALNLDGDARGTERRVAVSKFLLEEPK